MAPLILAATVWFSAFVVHLILWRWRLPAAQLRALLAIFCVVFVAACLLMVAGLLSSDLGGEGGKLVGFLYFALPYWAAALCYVITYSAMEGDSPTLSLTRHLHAKGGEGVPHEEVEEFFRRRPFVGARVKALVADNIFVEEVGGYRLSPGRYLFFRVILGYRRIVLGALKSGG